MTEENNDNASSNDSGQSQTPPSPPPNTESTKGGEQEISKPSAPLNKVGTYVETSVSDSIAIRKSDSDSKSK